MTVENNIEQIKGRILETKKRTQINFTVFGLSLITTYIELSMLPPVVVESSPEWRVLGANITLTLAALGATAGRLVQSRIYESRIKK